MEKFLNLTASIDKKEDNKKRKIQRRQDDDFFNLRRQREREFVKQQAVNTFRFFNEMEELELYEKKMKKIRRRQEILEKVNDRIRATKFNLLIIFHSKRYWNSDVFMVILSYI
jgi:hypothetical protein